MNIKSVGALQKLKAPSIELYLRRGVSDIAECVIVSMVTFSRSLGKTDDSLLLEALEAEWHEGWRYQLPFIRGDWTAKGEIGALNRRAFKRIMGAMNWDFTFDDPRKEGPSDPA